VSIRIRASRGGIELEAELERDRLLPGRLVAGVVRVTTREPIRVRGAFATLVGTEHWQWERSERSSDGTWRTETVTSRDELPRVPVALLGLGLIEPGSTHALPFELPVPPLGPATLDATVAGVTWELQVKLDIPDRLDAGLEIPVQIAQPTALLRAGVVDTGQFALYPAADSRSGDATATVELDPVPLCLGQKARARLTIGSQRETLQEVRAELRSRIRSTVSRGREEEITIASWRISGPGEFGGSEESMEVELSLPDRALPTIELPHGRADAQLHLILARSLAFDTHLVRDVAVCTTTEL
jgi:sporulation-control protein spo0M